jgi:Carboxypeptidase regulatory-like domain
MRMPPVGFGLAAALGLLGFLSACDRSPTQPGLPDTSSSSSTSSLITRLEIAGPATVPPGETVQYRALATYGDGSIKDVTGSSQWQSRNVTVLSFGSDGLATGRALGETTITAQHTSLRSSSEIIIVPNGTYRLVGSVSEADAPAPVVGATIDVQPASAAVTALTDSFGRYRLYGVPADAEIRVTKDGYAPAAQHVQLTDHMTLNFQLALARPRPTVAGTYVLAVDMNCSGSNPLPDDLRRRSYTAVLTQNGPDLEVTLTGADFAVNSAGKGSRFRGRVDPAGATFSFDTGDLYYYYGPSYYPDVVERLSTGMFLVLRGSAVTTLSSAGLTGTFNGSLVQYDSRFPRNFVVNGCSSPTNRFTLSR